VRMNDQALPSPASRDREGTQRRILEAARQVLADLGPTGFGINAVARAAGCDKQLIYRYFGGSPGLIEAMGTDLAALWIEKLGQPGKEAESYGAVMRALATRLLAVLRSEPLLRKIALWELTDASPQVQDLARARSRAMAAFVQEARGTLAPPAGVDAAVVNALLVGGLHQLVLSAQTSGTYTGLSLVTDSDWARIEDGLVTILDRVYAAGAPP
jgi:AcrR family transcriptional regulator